VTHADTQSIVFDYLPVFAQILTQPLCDKQSDGIEDVEHTMDVYSLTKEDRDNILEISGITENPAIAIPAQVKAAFTRRFNQDHYDMKKISEYKKEGGGTGKGKKGGKGKGEKATTRKPRTKKKEIMCKLGKKTNVT